MLKWELHFRIKKSTGKNKKSHTEKRRPQPKGTKRTTENKTENIRKGNYIGKNIFIIVCHYPYQRI